MSKKLITVLVVLAAFALPATASATNDPDVTQPTGTLAPTNIRLDATGLGTQILTDTAGNKLTECTKATMTGTLTKNSGTEVEGNIESTSFSGTGANGECTSTFGGITVDTNIGNGTPWCLRSTPGMATDEFQVRGNSCANAARSITFVLTSTTVGSCKYSRSEPIKGTYTTHATGDAILTLGGLGATAGTDSEFTKEEGGIFCPSVSPLDMSFTLETDTTASADPLYIS